MTRTRPKTAQKKPFDKYDYYSRAVQSPDGDAVFFRKVFRDHKGKDPIVFREDFCGTFALCCEWVKLSKDHRALGVDLDPEPLEYGRVRYLSDLKPEQSLRVQVFRSNVLWGGQEPADITAALNFSYFIFKERATLLKYFIAARKSLKPDGIFILDLFGGSLCHSRNEESIRHPGFTYYWDQKNFDPVSNGAHFAIHFKPHKGKKRLNIFTYDWRMWTLPELKELLIEAGFAKTTVYWEGTNRKGHGSGRFRPVTKGEECQSWIAYLVSEIR